MVAQSHGAESDSGSVYVTSMDQLKKLHPDEVKKNDFYLVAPHLIEVEPHYNARDLSKYEDHIESLKRQWISGPSLIPPIIISIKNGHVFVRDGHCRLEAANRAIAEGCSIHRITCQIFRGTETEQDVLILKTQQGAKLDHVEQAIVYARMAARGATNKEIAEILDVSEQQVKNMLQIHSLSDRLKKYITTGVVRYYALLEMLRGEDGNEDKVAEYIDAVIAKNASNDPQGGDGTQGDTARTGKRKASVTLGSINKAKGGIARFTPAIKKHTQSFLTSLFSRIDIPEGDTTETVTVTLTPEDLKLLASLRSVAVAPQEEPEAPNQLTIDMDPDDHPHAHLIEESSDGKSPTSEGEGDALRMENRTVIHDGEYSQLPPGEDSAFEEDPRNEFFS